LKGIKKYINRSPFLIKLLNWEYWPFNLIYFPIYLYWLFLSVKARSLFFFRAANPGIETGGMIGESKITILDMVPSDYKPPTIFLINGTTTEQVIKLMKINKLSYPIILKPDIGERGWKVEKIENRQSLNQYLEKNRINLLLQDYVDLPIELAVMYYRFPGEKKGKVISLAIKEFLCVTGDGNSSVLDLIKAKPRAFLQMPVLKEKYPDLMPQIPDKNEEIELVSIGNHCRGTKFLNGNHLIDDGLTKAFDRISDQLTEVYFCRFDIKCNSIAELKEGKQIRIMEINGVGSEPAHIYDPHYTLIQAYGDLFHQWKMMYRISKINRKKGASYMSLREAIKKLRSISQYKKLAEAA